MSNKLSTISSEHSIKLEASVTQKRPACPANTSTKYKTLAHKQQKTNKD